MPDAETYHVLPSSKWEWEKSKTERNHKHTGMGTFMKEIFSRHVRTKLTPKPKHKLEQTDSIITCLEIYTLSNKYTYTHI